MRARIVTALQGRADRVVAWQRALTALPALGPENGGQGEEAKARCLEAELRRMGMPRIWRLDAPDSRVACGFRPNIVARLPGRTPRTLWILAHMDVVPPGDLSLWGGDPWTLRVEGDALIGRGVEDNQQALVSGLLLAETLLESGVAPTLGLGLIFVSDEETGNAYGAEYAMRERPDLFPADDLYIAPDFGAPDGSMLEVAEKHVLWLRFVVAGKQCHASTPQKGVNAMSAGSRLALRLENLLPRRFPAADGLFSPPSSTFTLTRREANVPNINTVPATDVFYMDCRLLPSISPDAVLEAANDACRAVERELRVTATVAATHRLDAAPPTPADSPVVRGLAAAVRDVCGVEALPTGVGGSTVACCLRRAGRHAAVWSRLLSKCHEPDETALISNHISDAQVFAHLLFP